MIIHKMGKSVFECTFLPMQVNGPFDHKMTMTTKIVLTFQQIALKNYIMQCN